MSDTVINSTYKIGAKLGAGSFGRIYSATNLKTQEEVAIKVEDLKSKAPQLLYEAKLYQCLLGDNPSAVEGIPRVYQCTTQSHYNLLVMDLLGPSLEDLFNLCGRQFSLKTVLMLAEQMLTRTEYVHGRSFLHRDIKPDNFLIGVGKKQSTVYIIDFGLSKKYVKDGRHIEFTEGKKLTGTARYASINTHKGFEQGRRDDLESLCYVWVYFLKGSLPWQGLKANDKQQRYEKIRDKKVEVSISELCEGLPAEFAEYMTYVRNLKFDEKPDYNRLHELFRGLMAKKNFSEDFEFDWVTKAREGKVRLSDARNIALEKKRENEGPMVINEDNLLFEKKSVSTFGVNRNKKEDNNQRVIGESSLAVKKNSQIFKASPTDLTTQGLGQKIASITPMDNETPHKQLKARV